MKLGIVGLPNVGKSTLFNSLTKAGAESANYPFCTIDPNVGVVTVPDERLKLLGDFYHSKKVTPAVIEFVDIAGLVKGASKGEGLGNQFLANIREVDAIVHVVRCFEDSNVIHVDGSIDPIRDIETINLELIFSDLEILERRIAKVTKTARMDKEAAKELDFLQKVKTHLEDGKMAITMEMENEDEEAWMSTYNLLTWKPVIYAANVAEGDLADDGESNSHVQAVRKYAAEQNSEIFVICAEIEEEISELDDDEKKMFLEDLGLTESGLEKLNYLRSERNLPPLDKKILNDPSKYIDAILDERKFEFYGENHYFYDLVRLGKALDKLVYTKNKYQFLLPIPQSQVNLGLKQNPGYF